VVTYNVKIYRLIHIFHFSVQILFLTLCAFMSIPQKRTIDASQTRHTLAVIYSYWEFTNQRVLAEWNRLFTSSRWTKCIRWIESSLGVSNPFSMQRRIRVNMYACNPYV